MTIEQLYNWAKENGYENLNLKYDINWTDYEDYIHGNLNSKHFVFDELQNAVVLQIDAGEEVK